jgi:hypothetical protein
MECALGWGIAEAPLRDAIAKRIYDDTTLCQEVLAGTLHDGELIAWRSSYGVKTGLRLSDSSRRAFGDGQATPRELWDGRAAS